MISTLARSPHPTNGCGDILFAMSLTIRNITRYFHIMPAYIIKYFYSVTCFNSSVGYQNPSYLFFIEIKLAVYSKLRFNNYAPSSVAYYPIDQFI